MFGGRLIRCGVTFIFVMLVVGMRAYGVDIQRFRFGIHVDPMVHWYYSDSKSRYQNGASHFGVVGGLEAEYQFARRYGVYSGVAVGYRYGTLEYEMGGNRLVYRYLDPVDIPAGSSVESRSPYVQVPVGLKLRAVQIGYFSVVSALGAVLTFPFDTRAVLTHGGESLDREATKGYHSVMQAGLQVRLGVEYELGARTALEAGVGYQHLFNSVVPVDRGHISAGAVQFRIGFYF